MRTTFTYLLLSLAFIISGLSTQAQKSPSKFGKIDNKDLEATVCPIDSSAQAYYIFDCGLSQFIYANKTIDTYNSSNNKGFQLSFKRHFRIKILDEQAYSWANIEIPLYHSGGGKEDLGRIKACTYNMEGGKVIKTKLEKSAINTEETNKYWDVMKFAMPNVKVGSIIEVEYQVTSDFYFNLQKWFFQRSIPTLFSEYEVEIPEYFKYNISQSGYLTIHTEKAQRQQRLNLTFKSTDPSSNREKYEQSFDYQEDTYIFTIKNSPAFPKEQFLKTEKNYLSKVEFELQSTQFENGNITNYTTTWDEIDKDLMDDYNFGKALSHLGHLKEAVSQIKSQGKDNHELVSLALDHIKRQISWNNFNSKYIKTSLSKPYKDKTGNCSEINLNLVGLLRELGLTSHPVILSTRSNGVILPTHPSVSRFNYVIAMVVLDGETCLLDATDPDSGINLLPIRCLNDKGRIIGDTGEKWINLMDYMSYKSISNYSLALSEDLSICGKAELRLEEYAAYNERKEIGETNDLAEYEKKKSKELTNGAIKNMQVEGAKDLSDLLHIQFEIDKKNQTTSTEEMVYFSPVIDPFFKKNPFKLEKRGFPVEFSYPYNIRQTYKISIPEGYQVSELPEKVMATLPNNYGRFIYQVQQIGNDLLVTSMFTLRKSLFLPSEYDGLKKFFQLVIDKQNEFVILKSI